MVVTRLLGRQAFMGCVAAVGKPRPLLKCLHAVLSLLWDTDGGGGHQSRAAPWWQAATTLSNPSPLHTELSRLGSRTETYW